MQNPEPGLSQGDKKRALLVWTHRVLFIAGGLLLAFYAFARLDGLLFSQSELARFDAVLGKNAGSKPGKGDIDFSLWSEQRVRAFTQSLELPISPALAVLELSRLRIRVPVFEGTDDLALNRGAGWVKGTARPGQTGNTAIAGHRDGFFRGLKDVQLGDLIELQMQDKTMVYRINHTEIITPDEIRVLLPQAKPTLTLVTCYPFYYVGSAPKRFIVQALLEETKVNPAQHSGQ